MRSTSSRRYRRAGRTAIDVIKGHPEFVFLDDSSGTPELYVLGGEADAEYTEG
ncbi:hypothetical protein ACWFRJ_34335 [Streptomyces sp. NPDC055239]